MELFAYEFGYVVTDPESKSKIKLNFSGRKDHE